MVNEIIHGDCIDVMRGIAPDTFDICITSPPYNMRENKSRWMVDNSKWNSAKLKDGYESHSDDMPRNEYIEWQRECLNEILRVTKGCVFYNTKWRIQNGLLDDRSEILSGFPVRQVIIWKRSGGINFNAEYFLPTYEVIYMIAKKGFRLKRGASSIGDVWDIKQESKNPHPAPFPIEIPKIILKSCDADSVIDPFVGSGTTCVAAKSLGINYLGIDNSKEYVSMALDRLKTIQEDFL